MAGDSSRPGPEAAAAYDIVKAARHANAPDPYRWAARSPHRAPTHGGWTGGRPCYEGVMKGILADLVSLLGLERLDRDLFRGRSQDLGWGPIFGGQVVGQALSAAAQTVGGGRIVHSLHGYFMRAGDVHGSIVYQIDRLRDGKSFSTRRVVAVQEGEAIFSLEASFQSEEEGLDHQDPMPEVPAPETLRSERDIGRGLAGQLP